MCSGSLESQMYASEPFEWWLDVGTAVFHVNHRLFVNESEVFLFYIDFEHTFLRDVPYFFVYEFWAKIMENVLKL